MIGYKPNFAPNTVYRRNAENLATCKCVWPKEELTCVEEEEKAKIGKRESRD